MNVPKIDHNVLGFINRWDTVQIALSIYDPTGSYARHAGATMVSIFANTSASVCIHILHDDTLIQDNRDHLRKIANEYQQDIQFHQVKLTNMLLSLQCGKLTQGTLFRLLVPNILRERRIIYLDCDVIVDLDIEELWRISVTGYPLAAVLDGTLHGGISCWEEKDISIIKRNGIKLEKYFNAGVLFLNLEYLREHHNLVQEASHFLATHESVYMDQDALNFIFQQKFLQLDDVFNSMTMIKGTCNGNGRIWHWAGQKPWNGFTGMIDILYWHYLSLTPWNNEARAFFSILSNIESSTVLGKKIIVFGAGSCGERIWRQLPVPIQYFVDNNKTKWGGTLQGIPVLSPECLHEEDKNGVIVIVGSQYYSEIVKQLIDMGFKKFINFM